MNRQLLVLLIGGIGLTALSVGLLALGGLDWRPVVGLAGGGLLLVRAFLFWRKANAKGP
jgi:hypothetical protein